MKNINDRLEKIEKQRNQQTQTEHFKKVQEEVKKGVDAAIAHYNCPEAVEHRKKWRELYDKWMEDNGYKGKGRPSSMTIDEYWDSFREHLVSIGFYTAEYLKALKEDENYFSEMLGMEKVYPEYDSIPHNDIDSVMEQIIEIKEGND